MEHREDEAGWAKNYPGKIRNKDFPLLRKQAENTAKFSPGGSAFLLKQEAAWALGLPELSTQNPGGWRHHKALKGPEGPESQHGEQNLAGECERVQAC